MEPMKEDSKSKFWSSWQGMFLVLLLAALLFFLITEHTAHFLGVLPYAIFLVCPLLHIFMHRHGSKTNSREKGGHRH